MNILKHKRFLNFLKCYLSSSNCLGFKNRLHINFYRLSTYRPFALDEATLNKVILDLSQFSELYTALAFPFERFGATQVVGVVFAAFY